jgi:hypothetical protein
MMRVRFTMSLCMYTLCMYTAEWRRQAGTQMLLLHMR